MNTKLRNDAKKDFEKDFFKLLNNIRNYRDIKIVTTKKKKKKTGQFWNQIIIQKNTFKKSC